MEGPLENQDPSAAPDAPQGLEQQDIDALLQSASQAAPADGASPNEAAGAGASETSAAAPSRDAGPTETAADAATRTPDLQSFSPPEIGPSKGSHVDAQRVRMLSDVSLPVRIELGRTRMLVEDVLKLGDGSVVELEKLAGDPVDVYVNDRLVARGEVLVLNDSFCVRVSDVLSHDPHRVIQ